MNRLAKQQVHLYWFAGIPSWERIRADLYPRYTGGSTSKPDVRRPLQPPIQPGIYPEVQVLEGTNFPRVYESMEDGFSNIRESLGLCHQEHDGLIRDYLERRGKLEGDRVMLEDATTYVRISWRTEERSL
jgi:hypothetical protein